MCPNLPSPWVKIHPNWVVFNPVFFWVNHFVLTWHLQTQIKCVTRPKQVLSNWAKWPRKIIQVRLVWFLFSAEIVLSVIHKNAWSLDTSDVMKECYWETTQRSFYTFILKVLCTWMWNTVHYNCIKHILYISAITDGFSGTSLSSPWQVFAE